MDPSLCLLTTKPLCSVHPLVPTDGQISQTCVLILYRYGKGKDTGADGQSSFLLPFGPPQKAEKSNTNSDRSLSIAVNKQATPSLVTKIVTVYHAPRFFWSEWNSKRHHGNSSSIDRDRQGDTKVGSDLSLEAGSVWRSTNSQLVWVYCHCPVAWTLTLGLPHSMLPGAQESGNGSQVHEA